MWDYPGIPAARRMELGNRRLEKLFAGLDIAFEAAAAREDEVAASDFAFSLAQDRTLHDVLERVPGADLCIEGGGRAPIRAAGADYFETEPRRVLVPAAGACVRIRASGPAVQIRADCFLDLLRREARAGAAVAVRSGGAEVAGRLAYAGRDHIAVDDASGRVLVAVAGIRAVTIASRD